MSLRSLGRSAREAWEVPRDLLLGRYPAFVTGGPLERGVIPVFVFHGAEPVSFSRKLEHLARNGYRTLSIDEYVAVLRGRCAPPERAVLLTFDDGRGSVWSVAAPLLKRHGMKAVVFLVPGRIPSRPPGPDWDDVAAGRAAASVVLEREHGEGALLSWQEIERLAGGGLFDFQSHTLLHSRIHTAPSIAGFVTPRTRAGYDAFDQPLVRDGERDLLGSDVPLGTPLLRSEPRTSDALRFFEEPELRAAASRRSPTPAGPPSSSARTGSRGCGRSSPGAAFAGGSRRETSRQAAIRHELVEARRVDRGAHRAARRPPLLPVARGGPRRATAGAPRPATRRRSAARCGGVPITRPGGDPLAIARLGEDYVELLPGKRPRQPARAAAAQMDETLYGPTGVRWWQPE